MCVCVRRYVVVLLARARTVVRVCVRVYVCVCVCFCVCSREQCRCLVRTTLTAPFYPGTCKRGGVNANYGTLSKLQRDTKLGLELALKFGSPFKVWAIPGSSGTTLDLPTLDFESFSFWIPVKLASPVHVRKASDVRRILSEASSFKWGNR